MTPAIELVRQRVERLHYFFKHRLGPLGWQSRLALRRGKRKNNGGCPGWLRNPRDFKELSLQNLSAFETLALKLGYVEADERKPFARERNPDGTFAARLNVAVKVLTVENHLALGDLGPNSLESP